MFLSKNIFHALFLVCALCASNTSFAEEAELTEEQAQSIDGEGVKEVGQYVWQATKNGGKYVWKTTKWVGGKALGPVGTVVDGFWPETAHSK